MAGKGDIEAGKAFIRLFLKDDMTKNLRESLGNVSKGLAVAAAGMAGIGASAAVGIGAAVKHFADAGSVLNDVSGRTGVAASSLAELQFAAEQSGASFEDVEKALIGMAKKGLDVADFDRVAAEIASIEDPSERAATAVETFGKSGAKLIPMLGELQALREEARDLGLAPSEEEIARADAMGDSFDKLKAVMSASLFKIGAAFAPIVQAGVDAATQIVAAFNRWMETNETVIGTLKAIGQALSAGEFTLAFEIAAKSAEVAFQSLFTWLGGTLGDIGTKYVEGDFAGAWETAVAKMGEVWAAFTVGVVETFSAAANGVLEVWAATTKKIADLLLEHGIIANVGQMQGESDKLDARQMEFLAKQRWQAEQDLEFAKRNGGKMQSGTGEVTVAMLEKRLADIMARIEGGGVKRTDVLGGAKAASGAHIDAMKESGAAFVEGLRKQAMENFDAAAKKLAGKSGGDPADVLGRLKDELADLRAGAAEAAASVTGAKTDKTGIVDALLGERQAVGTFSAAGAVALQGGSGASPWQKLADAVKGGSKVEPKMLTTLERIERKIGGPIFA